LMRMTRGVREGLVRPARQFGVRVPARRRQVRRTGSWFLSVRSPPLAASHSHTNTARGPREQRPLTPPLLPPPVERAEFFIPLRALTNKGAKYYTNMAGASNAAITGTPTHGTYTGDLHKPCPSCRERRGAARTKDGLSINFPQTRKREGLVRVVRRADRILVLLVKCPVEAPGSRWPGRRGLRPTLLAC
jgi:hypothetical protein